MIRNLLVSVALGREYICCSQVITNSYSSEHLELWTLVMHATIIHALHMYST